jgi:hypothetical protein
MEILKAYDYFLTFNNEEDHKFVRALVKGGSEESAMTWLKALDEDNKRDAYAWRHSPGTDVPTFRLDDHVWIWNSLKGISVILDWNKENKNVKKAPKGRERMQMDKTPEQQADEMRRKYDPVKVQREITKRFTTENEQLKQRMLAVTRSPRENRFLFHSRDTALLYDLYGTEKMLTEDIEVWKNALVAQRTQEANQDMEWDNPLRYALTMMMAQVGHSINRADRIESFERAKSVILTSALPNGLFPGQIDEATKEERLFEDKYYRDFYFHASFEIPYLLWRYGTLRTTSANAEPSILVQDYNPVLSTVLPSPTVLPNSPTYPRRPSMDSRAPPPVRSPTRENSYFFGFDNTREIIGQQAVTVPKEPGLLKKSTPFNDFIDSQNIVDVHEEWLYAFPKFLDCAPARASLRYDAITSILLGNAASHYSDVLLAAIQAYKERVLSQGMRRPSVHQGEVVGSDFFYPHQSEVEASLPYNIYGNLVWDVAKKKTQAKRGGRSIIMPPHDHGQRPGLFWSSLYRKRTAELAKKRFIWMPYATLDSVLMCFLVSPDEDEREEISLFFDRHVNHEKFYFDEAVRVYNTWNTQFHISFLMLQDDLKSDLTVLNLMGRDHTDANGLDSPSFNPHTLSYSNVDKDFASGKASDRYPNFLMRPVAEGIPMLNSRRLVRAAAGYRITGDFIDRYWTCHMIEFYPSGPRRSCPLWSEPEAGSYKQRKVLELMLFTRIIGEVNSSMKMILGIVQERLGLETGRSMSLKNLKFERYLNTSLEWEDLGRILDILDSDLKEIQDHINEWEERRERDRLRELERPRWTKDDERKYRRAISKMLVLARQTMRQFRSNQSSVRNLRNSLAVTQERIRNELGLRGNENIRYFTYATVVFLPLGFSASLFSMQTAPSHSLIRQMVVVAVIAILVTIVLVMNAQYIWKAVRHPRKSIRDTTKAIKAKTSGIRKDLREGIEEGRRQGQELYERRRRNLTDRHQRDPDDRRRRDLRMEDEEARHGM